MANATTVKIGKREVTLRYNFAAAAELSRRGINIFNPSTYSEFTPHQMLTLVWAGQLHSKNALNEAAIAEELSLDADDIVAIATAVSTAIAAAINGKAKG